MAVILLMHAGGEDRRRKVGAHAASEIVYAQRHKVSSRFSVYSSQLPVLSKGGRRH